MRPVLVRPAARANATPYDSDQVITPEFWDAVVEAPSVNVGATQTMRPKCVPITSSLVRTRCSLGRRVHVPNARVGVPQATAGSRISVSACVAPALNPHICADGRGNPHSCVTVCPSTINMSA